MGTTWSEFASIVNDDLQSCIQVPQRLISHSLSALVSSLVSTTLLGRQQIPTDVKKRDISESKLWIVIW